MSAGGPALSVILPTDTYATVRNVVAAFRAQTIADQLEIVIVTGSSAGLGDPDGVSDGFHSVAVVEVERLYPLQLARAKAVRRARAPLVLIAESHAYPEPHHCEALIRAHQGRWAAVGPRLSNANPGTARSWAALFIDYGPWVDARERGEVANVSGHNSCYKRSSLLEFGEHLEAMMLSSINRHADMRARGHVMCVEPDARTFHLNVSRPGAWVEERVVAGRAFAAGRALTWAWPRRLLYALGSPLIPAVRLRRILSDMKASGHSDLLARTLPVLVFALLVSALGEGLGYALGAGSALERVNEMELHKEDFVRRGERPSADALPRA